MHLGYRSPLPPLLRHVVSIAAALLATQWPSALAKSVDAGAAAGAKRPLLRCGNAGASANVRAGAPIVPGQYPWLAYIRQVNQLRPTCGASVIAPNLLATAAHCLLQADGTPHRAADLWAFVRAHNVSSEMGGGRGVPIRRIFIHDRYERKSTAYDLAVVETLTTMDVEPLCLPCQLDADAFDESSLAEPFLPYDQTCFVVGWGATKTSSYSDVPLAAKLRVRRHERCAQAYGDVVSRSALCASADSSGSDSEESAERAAVCQGDSGSALMCLSPRSTAFVLSGVVHGATVLHGGLCADKPGIFTSVASLRRWLHTVLKETGNEPYCPWDNGRPATCDDYEAYCRPQASRPCDALLFETVKDTYVLGTQTVGGGVPEPNVNSTYQCRLRCCELTDCNSMLYYERAAECYTFREDYCDVKVRHAELTQRNTLVTFYGKKCGRL